VLIGVAKLWARELQMHMERKAEALTHLVTQEPEVTSPGGLKEINI